MPVLTSPPARRIRTSLLLLSALLLAAPGVPPVAHAAGALTACGTGQVVFADVAGTTHEQAITCLVDWAVASGHADGTFRPDRDVSRAQLATFLYRLLTAVQRAPAPADAPFSDVQSGDTHAAAIGALAALDIVRGVSETSFKPDAPVTRGQLASLIARTHEQVFGATLSIDGAVAFSDTDGSIHELGITRLATAGVVMGRTDGSFGPAEAVTRGQMATFLARYTALLVAADLAAPPATGGLDAWRAPATTAWVLGDQRHFGVATPDNGSSAALREVAGLLGTPPSIVLTYLGLTDELDLARLQAAADTGATPLLTWEPYDWRSGTVEQPQFQLRRIVDGAFDADLRRTAATIRAFGEPVLLRFAHEMNGDWYPWSEQVNGNRPGEYVAAWRHVHRLFGSLGVTNVSWVWSPNVEYEGSTPLAGLYPGHAYVDAVAIDGYNWGTVAPWSTWQTPSEVFDPTLAAVRRLAPGVPLMIGETGSTETGGNKAVWIEQLFRWLEANADVRSLVWFHLDKETDWRIDSSPAALGAFAQGLAAWAPKS